MAYHGIEVSITGKFLNVNLDTDYKIKVITLHYYRLHYYR